MVSTLCSLVAACVAAAGAAEKAPAVELFVAADGRDTWSGRRPEPDGARTDGPFATLQRARDEVRRLKAAGRLGRGVTVHVRAGTYALDSTFVLGPADSGTADAPVVYRGYDGERPVLTGGRTVTGWQPWRNGILRCDMKAMGLEGVFFRQLFWNGHRQHLARFPNFDPDNPYSGGWAMTGDRPAGQEDVIPDKSPNRMFYYRPEHTRDWAHPEDVEVMIFPKYNWWNHILPIKRIDRARRLVELAEPGLFPITPDSRYYFRNAMEELDSPGEWFLDRRDGTLYFRPPGDVSKAEVTVPVLDVLVKLEPGAEHIELRDFTLEYWHRNAVVMDQARHCRLAGCTIRHGTGLALREPAIAAVDVSGGSGCQVVGNDLYDVGSHGVLLDGGDRETLAPAGHVADNNYIHHVGIYFKQGYGIGALGVGNRVSHNLIHDGPRWGIYFRGNDHVIENNHIRHVCVETDDTGAIYAYANGGNWAQRGTVVRHNYIHDVLGYGRKDRQWLTPYYAWGVYLDGSTSGVTVVGNILVRCSYGGGMNNGSHDNLWENNLFVDGGTAQISFNNYMPPDFGGRFQGNRKKCADDVTRYGPLPAYQKYRGYQLLRNRVDEAWKMQRNAFRRNVICYSNPEALLYNTFRLPDDENEFDGNLIWHHGMPLRFRRSEFTGVPDEQQWDAWRKRGHDAHSVVADPLFVDPARDDYRLRPESPAWRLGFKPISVDEIGPYRSPDRASWPIQEAAGVRENPVRPAPPLDDPTTAGRGATRLRRGG